MEDLKVELTSLGVRTSEGGTAPGFFAFTPIDRAQAFGAYANHQFSLVNSQGRTFKRGVNGGLTFESRAQLGDFLSLYLQPELLENEDYGAARLATGYAKLTVGNVELLVGRDSLAWGPGYHNGLLLTNNAAPLDQIKIGAAEPFLLPWIGKWVGPMKALIFLAQLEERRDHAYTKLSGMRLTFAPAAFLELGASHTVLFDGLGPDLPLRKYPEAIFNPGFGDVRTHPEERTNGLSGLDADLRLHDVDRYRFPSRDLRLYGEFYWDDTCGECGPSTGVGHWFASNLLPKGRTTGGVGGVHFLELFGQDWLDARFEYARTSPVSLNHDQFASGYWTRGHVISDFIGTDGTDYFGRLAARVTPNLMVGLDLDRAVIGSTAKNFPGPQEKRLGGSVDVSYRFWGRYSLFAQYMISDVKNRQFRPGDDGLDPRLDPRRRGPHLGEERVPEDRLLIRERRERNEPELVHGHRRAVALRLVGRREADHGEQDGGGRRGAGPPAAAELGHDAAGGADAVEEAAEDPSHPGAQRAGHEDTRERREHTLGRPRAADGPAHPCSLDRHEGEHEPHPGHGGEPCPRPPTTVARTLRAPEHEREDGGGEGQDRGQRVALELDRSQHHVDEPRHAEEQETRERRRPRPDGARRGNQDDRDQEGDEKRVEVGRARMVQHRVVSENEMAAVDEIHQHGEHRAPPQPRAGERAAASLGGHGEEQADRRDAGPQMELKVGRAPDEDVLTEGVVPPRVHRRGRGDHTDADRGDGEAQRQLGAPEAGH